MNDPRVEALTTHFLSYSDFDGPRGTAVCKCGHESPFNAWMDPDGDLDERVHIRHQINVADAADREQGIHRVRVDDETVEHLAKFMANRRGDTQCCTPAWDSLGSAAKKSYTELARAVLDAITGACS